MVSVVRPHGHLSLRVVQRMQGPPCIGLVLCPVNPVVHKVEQDQVDHKTDQRQIGHPRPQTVEVKCGQTHGAQPAQALLKQIVKREKHHQFEQAQAVDQGVDHIDPHCPRVSDRLHWPAPLHRANHHPHHRQLQQAHHHPARALVGFFEQIALPCGKGDGLNHGLIKRGLQAFKKVDQHIHGVIFANRAKPAAAGVAVESSRGRPGVRARWQSTGHAPSGPR